MSNKNPLYLIKQLNENTEVWWDSSPLIYDSWVNEFIDRLNPNERGKFRGWLKELISKDDPKNSFFDGCTTNPPLTKQVLDLNRQYWTNWIEEKKLNCKCLTYKDLSWDLYSEIVKRGAEVFTPKFISSKFKLGYISGQVDPRQLTNTREMVREAIELNYLSQNVMIKMPGTKEGIFGIQILTSLGIPTNATLVFSVPQILAVAEAVKNGLEVARKNNVDLSKWRSVITMMLGRFEDSKAFEESARKVGVTLNEELKRWAGIAIFKKAYNLLKKGNYESKLLAASMRVGPKEDGKTRIWHIEKLVGGDVVLTIFPNVIEAFMVSYQNERINSSIDEEVPLEAMKKLEKIPYFMQAYEEEGIRCEDFISYPPTIETASSFSSAMDDIENLVKTTIRTNNQ